MLVFFSAAASILIASCDATTSTQTDDGIPAVEAKQALQESGHASSDLGGALEAYVDSDLYVVVDADIDMDGALDKVVSNARNRGNELIFFKSTEGGYRTALVSTNLTEDGGRILGEIKQATGDVEDGEVVSIETFFPKGMDVATHYISYSNNEWELSRTVYKVSDWKNRENVIYLCEVKQGIPMRDLVSEEVVSMVRQIPDESVRDQVCKLESSPET
ncbi:hypothetical protein [Luteimonas sp. R10]|uniref:hypothetical protein n=1 Tax=Luteimonas sp. R10 TaxID=3108176 RepID=UPI00308FF09A|nr:hypothetical protein U3649_13390 [Luteimonas sp. R10]